MRTSMHHLGRKAISLATALIVVFSLAFSAPLSASAASKDASDASRSGLAAASFGYRVSSTGIEVSATNLTVDPAGVNGADDVHVSFKYQITKTTSGTAYFKEGETVQIATNFKDMFDCDQSFEVPVLDYGGNDLGTLAYNRATGNVVFTVHQAAERMEYHTFTGTFDSFKHFKAKNVSETTEYTVTAGIGAAATATAPLKITALDRQLTVQSSGKGSLSGVTGTITLHKGDEVEIVATPADSGDPAEPNQVLAATLIRSDKTTKIYGKPILPSSDTVRFRVDYSNLKPGLNTFVVAFTAEQETNNEEGFYPGERDTSVYKRLYNRDWNTYVQGVPVLYRDGAAGMSANNDIYVNTKGIVQLYGSEGEQTNNLSKLIVEDTLPGGAVGTLPNNQFGLKIYAVMPYWFTGTDGKTKAINPESGRHVGYKPAGAAGNTELISNGYLEKIEQQAGETLEQFRSRVSAAPLSYGVFIDPSTNETTWIANLGSPGNANGPALKCSQLWPAVLARDVKLKELNGDSNCVGGNVQYFRITYYCDHNKVRFTTLFTNTAKLTSTEVEEQSSVPYAVKCDNALGEGHKSTLTVHVVDALDQSKDIAGVDVKLEKWNDDTGAWEDATHEGRTYEGVTGAGGGLVLGESDGSVETGTLTPGKYRIREVSLPEHYSSKTMTVTAAPSSQGPISADGEFTVASTDTKGFVALVTNAKAYDVLYHANGGEGELVCPNNPHPAGTKAAVLAPGDSITRDGWFFVGWNTEWSGSGDWYSPGSEITMPEDDVNLYAQWMPDFKATVSLEGVKVWNDAGNAAGQRPGITDNDGQPIALELGNLDGYVFPEGTAAPKPTWAQDESDKNSWVYTFAGLPRFDSEGNEITWCVTETAPAGYAATYENGPEWDYMTDRAYPGGIIKNTLTTAPYSVQYFYQDRATGSYPATATSSVQRSGAVDKACAITDTDKKPDADHAGWVFDDANAGNVLNATVAMDGSTVLKVYLKAQYSVTYQPGEHGTFTAQTFNGLSYGDAVPAYSGAADSTGKPTGEEGWTFDGWKLETGSSVNVKASANALSAQAEGATLGAPADAVGLQVAADDEAGDSVDGDRTYTAQWKKAPDDDGDGDDGDNDDGDNDNGDDDGGNDNGDDDGGNDDGGGDGNDDGDNGGGGTNKYNPNSNNRANGASYGKSSSSKVAKTGDDLPIAPLASVAAIAAAIALAMAFRQRTNAPRGRHVRR